MKIAEMYEEQADVVLLRAALAMAVPLPISDALEDTLRDMLEAALEEWELT